MYEHILISTDGSEVSQKGVDQGLSLAERLAARVTVVMSRLLRLDGYKMKNRAPGDMSGS